MTQAHRFVIVGAGAVGGALGAALWKSGYEVTLLARGRHLDLLRERGLILDTPEGIFTHRIPVCEHPADAGIDAQSIVILAVKSQDTHEALDALARVVAADVRIVCAQNGVENERMALRLFDRVYGASVIIPASHLQPGTVEVKSWPTLGLLEVGRYPQGVDGTATQLAGELSRAGFAARAVPDVMRWKYAKLLSNVGNAVNAITGGAAREGQLYRRAREEALDCYKAAGIEYTSAEEDQNRRAQIADTRTSTSAPRGASSWQSLARRTGRVETDFLNGEVVLLGRLYGVATPVNEALQQFARRMAAAHELPGSVSELAVLAAADALALSSDRMMQG